MNYLYNAIDFIDKKEYEKGAINYLFHCCYFLYKPYHFLCPTCKIKNNICNTDYPICDTCGKSNIENDKGKEKYKNFQESLKCTFEYFASADEKDKDFNYTMLGIIHAHTHFAYKLTNVKEAFHKYYNYFDCIFDTTNNPIYLDIMAIVSMQQGDLEQSIKYIKKALEYDSKNQLLQNDMQLYHFLSNSHCCNEYKMLRDCRIHYFYSYFLNINKYS